MTKKPVKQNQVSKNTKANPDDGDQKDDVILWDDYETARLGAIHTAAELAGLLEQGDEHDAIALADQIDISGKLPVAALFNILFEQSGNDIISNVKVIINFEEDAESYTILSMFQAMYLEGKQLARMEGNLYEAAMARPVEVDPVAAEREKLARIKRSERGATGKGGGYVRRKRKRRLAAEEDLKKAINKTKSDK